MINRRQDAGTHGAIDGAPYHVQGIVKFAIFSLELCVIGRNILAHLAPYHTPWKAAAPVPYRRAFRQLLCASTRACLDQARRLAARRLVNGRGKPVGRGYLTCSRAVPDA